MIAGGVDGKLDFCHFSKVEIVAYSGIRDRGAQNHQLRTRAAGLLGRVFPGLGHGDADLRLAGNSRLGLTKYQSDRCHQANNFHQFHLCKDRRAIVDGGCTGAPTRRAALG